MITFRKFYLKEKFAEPDYRAANADIYLGIFGARLITLSVSFMTPGEHDPIQKLGWLRGMYSAEKDQWLSWNARIANHSQVSRAAGIRPYVYAFQMAWDRDRQAWLLWSDRGAKADVHDMKEKHPNLYLKIFGSKQIIYHDWK